MTSPCVVVVAVSDTAKKMDFIRYIRTFPGIGPAEASKIADGVDGVEVADGGMAKHFAEILGREGVLASIYDADAVPGIRRHPIAVPGHLGVVAAGRPSVRHDRSLGRKAEQSRVHQIVATLEARTRAAYSPPAEMSNILGDLNAQTREIDGALTAMRRALEGKDIRCTPEVVGQWMSRYGSGLQAAQKLEQEQRWMSQMPSEYDRHAFQRWKNEAPSKQTGTPGLTLESWLQRIALETEGVARPLRFWQAISYERMEGYKAKSFPLLAQGERLLTLLEKGAAAALEAALSRRFDRLKADLDAVWADILSDIPRAAGIDSWKPAWASGRSRSDAGLHPTISPVIARLSALSTSVKLVAPAPSSHVFEQEVNLTGSLGPGPDPVMPYFNVEIDLDQHGGFVTEHKSAIESAAVDLLGQLPGGRVKVDVIDPLQLGDSAKFLFDLNDAGDRILADAIWTTAEHMAKVLVQLEEHITFVTQKYLQGRNSLTEYNIEAGEIAEPYRLLILYDFPAGFSRDGKHFDEEHLTRLERIAAVGRRAGVYIFAHVPQRNDALSRLSSLVWMTAQGLGLGAPVGGVGDGQQPPATVAENVAGALTVAELDSTWEVVPQPAPDADTRRRLFAGLLRDLQRSETAKVDPSTISRLSQARQASDIEKGLGSEGAIDVDDPSTWWQSVSTERLQLAFGRMGASDIARVEFNSALESSALIGGRTGSGKSYLIHSLIMDAVMRYSPEELTLYLCDLKEGVEFKQYADAKLPHARAIAIESNREFAVSLLEALDDEITERGALFKAKTGGAAVNITQFRKESGQTWPRVMIVIDEFHKLFEQEDRLGQRALQLLERIIKEGRAFGVHTVLASQSLANVSAAFKSLAGQIPYRLVLSSSDADSRILLGDDNADAKLLTKAGEGILNAKGGARESNQRFQTTYWAPELRQAVLQRVAELAGQAGFDRRPHIFEGNAEVRADDFDPSTYRSDGKSLAIPVGAPMSMGPQVVTTLERAPGGNLLVVDTDGLEPLAVSITSLLGQGVEVIATDFSSVDQNWEPAFDALESAGMQKVGHRVVGAAIDRLSAVVAERHLHNRYHEEPKVLALIGVHRARLLDPNSYDDDSLLVRVRALAKDGPEVGVHLVAWADRKASLDRRFDHETLQQFGLRLLGRMSEDDSRSLADTERAASITPAQLVFDDFDRAVTLVVRRLGFPGLSWIDAVVGQR